MMLNRQGEAASFLAQLQEEFPNDPDILFLAVHMYSDLAYRNSEQLMKVAPDSPEVLRLNAENFEKAGDAKKAIGEYRVLLQKTPGQPGIHYRIGGLILEHVGTAGGAEEARKEFEEELKIDPSNASAEYYLGEIARQEERLPEAIEHFAARHQTRAGFRGSAIRAGPRAARFGQDRGSHCAARNRRSPGAGESHDPFRVGYRLSAHGAQGGCRPRVRAAEERGRQDQREHQGAAQEHRRGGGWPPAIATYGWPPWRRLPPCVGAAYGFQPGQPRRTAHKKPHFTDIAPRSKFSYVTRNDVSPRKYFPQPLAGGVAVFDFDEDGKLDIFFTNGAKLPELKKTGPAVL